MKKFLWVGRGVARIALVAVLVSVAATAIVELSPGSAGERAAKAAGVLPADDSHMPSELRAQIVSRVADIHGLDASVAARAARRVSNLFCGEFGRSWRTGAEIRGPLVRASIRTFTLIGLSLLVALFLGLASASMVVARGGVSGTVVEIGVALTLVTPPVWLALVLLGLVGAQLSWPLAVISMAMLPAALVSRHAIAALGTSARAPHAIAARARGVSTGRLVVVHGAREIGASLAALAPGIVGYLIGASMVIERVFGLRGLGNALADAAAIGDAPVVISAVIIAAVAVAATDMLARAVARACDPRLRGAR